MTASPAGRFQARPQVAPVFAVRCTVITSTPGSGRNKTRWISIRAVSEGCVSTAHLIGRAAGLACMRDKARAQVMGGICRSRPSDDRLPADFSPAFFWGVI